ncbi:hypothetical protein N9046_08670, partial [Akkermansiaceae bacterium]|nr:hypothetical protein [Akkermansiaceae bacterium]
MTKLGSGTSADASLQLIAFLGSFYSVSPTNGWTAASFKIELRTDSVAANGFCVPFLDKETHGDTKPASSTHERVERYHQPRYSRYGG